MNTPPIALSEEFVCQAVSRELELDMSDLTLQHLDGVNRFLVRSSKTGAVWKLWRSANDVETQRRNLLLWNLYTGSFFDTTLVTREVLDAAARCCNLADLTSFLTMASREGWVLPSHDGEDTEDRLWMMAEESRGVDDLKAMQTERLATWLEDPVDAVLKLQGGDLPSALAVLIEQCRFDQEALSRAMLAALGGWQAFEYLSQVILTTPEGHIITAYNAAAADYLDTKYGDKHIHKVVCP